MQYFVCLGIQGEVLEVDERTSSKDIDSEPSRDVKVGKVPGCRLVRVYINWLLGVLPGLVSSGFNSEGSDRVMFESTGRNGKNGWYWGALQVRTLVRC